MATQEKLLKSLEALKNLCVPNLTSDTSKRKEKMQHCHIITEAICNSTIKIAPNFQTYLSMTVEVLLQLCDDSDSNVRMIAEESLNRIIRALNDGNIGKIQIELHKAIKRNGAAKSVRAALWRFSQLAHLIKTHKGKAYVVNLFPYLKQLVSRHEELIHEALAGSLPEIMNVLGCFTSDNEIKSMLKAFLTNVSNESAVIRRSACSCIASICLNSRKPQECLVYVVNHLIDLIIPVNEPQETHLILGVLTCLKSLLPHLGVTTDLNLSKEKYLQIYELCLYFLTNKDHNIVNAALDLLNNFLQNIHDAVLESLFSGMTKSRIRLTGSSSLSALSSHSLLSTPAGDDLFLESELTETLRSDVEKWIDQSKLSLINAKPNFDQSMSTDISEDFSLTENESVELKIGTDYPAKERSLDDLDRLTLDDDVSEKSFTCIDGPNLPEVNIGTLFDKTNSLIYCGRLVTKLFLLNGQTGSYISDKSVRISTKSLALSCIAAIVKLYPDILLFYLDKTFTVGVKNLSNQKLTELLLYSEHPDPQLRGATRIIVAIFIKSVLEKNFGRYDGSIVNNDTLALESLVKMLTQGLLDESATCSRQTIAALNDCLLPLAHSSCNVHIQAILNVLPRLSSNPYWLVKAALCDLLSKLDYLVIRDVTESNTFQTNALRVLLRLLSDDDAKVRNAASSALISIIPNLYCAEFRPREDAVSSRAIRFRDMFMSRLGDDDSGHNVDFNRRNLIRNMPFPFCEMGTKNDPQVEFALAIVVSDLYKILLVPKDKHCVYGCLETLSSLSTAYSPVIYANAWNSEHCTDLFSLCMSFLTNSVVIYDSACHLHLLTLVRNLYAGHCLKYLQPVSSDTADNTETCSGWAMFTRPEFRRLTEIYLGHLLKLLNVLRHVVDDLSPIQAQSKTSSVIGNLSTVAASPIKRRNSDVIQKKMTSPGGKTGLNLEEKHRDGNKETYNKSSFVNLPHYMKVYDVVKAAYSNYKISLEKEACEKFLSLLRETLKSFTVLLEVGSLLEFRTIAEEILSNLRFTFLLDAANTVECVQQLLKALFGTNLTAYISDLCENRTTSEEDTNQANSSGFYYNLYQKPYRDVASCFNALNAITTSENCDSDSVLMGYYHRKEVQPLVPVKSSDAVLANYIRIFEPMVIKSLKHYTITNDVHLQCKVLQLLIQLIQLRVNYCLLDSEQIFIDFVLKQLEYLEDGQVKNASELIEKMFHFLVQLSYSKQHSKSIIDIPKIINLCDRLMASGQPTLTHCIPALEPVVANIFITRNKSNTTDVKELETTREVVLTMLLKLCAHHQVIDLIVLILNDSKYCTDNPDKWQLWSEQVLSVLIASFKSDKIALDSIEALVSLRRLVFALEPSVFSQENDILLLLFQNTPTESSRERWLGRNLFCLLILTTINEQALLTKIDELKSDFTPECIFDSVVPKADPLNVSNSADIFAGISAEMIFLRFILRTLYQATQIELSVFLAEEVSTLLLYCIHIFQSGSHCRLGNFVVKHLDELSERVEEINGNFVRVSKSYPTVSFLWCYILTIFGYTPTKFWMEIGELDTESLALNGKIARSSAVIVYCDYLNDDTLEVDRFRWFVKAFAVSVVNLSEEEPVAEFLAALHRHSETSKVFLEQIQSQCGDIKKPSFALKLLKCIENAHSDHTGALLTFLLPRFLLLQQLSVCRQVAMLASRKIEFLLTRPVSECQLSRADILTIIRQMELHNLVKKHESLASLLNKLCFQNYNVSPLEFDQKRTLDPIEIKQMSIDGQWFVSQLSRCRDARLKKEIAQLLNSLEDKDDIENYLESCQCQEILVECLRLGFSTKSTLLFEATANCLLGRVDSICARVEQPETIDAKTCSIVLDLVPSLNTYLELSGSSVKSDETLIKFAALTLNAAFLHRTRENLLEAPLKCASLILKRYSDSNLQPNLLPWLCSIVVNLYELLESLAPPNQPLLKLPVFGLNTNTIAGDACHKLYILSDILRRIPSVIPKNMEKHVRHTVVCLGRLQVFNSYVLIPPQVWSQCDFRPEIGGQFHTQVPFLPIELLQDVDILEEYIFRITLLGWTNRQQFEETWMCFLSVLCDYNQGNLNNDSVHAASVAVKAITSLLLRTMRLEDGSMLGCTRNRQIKRQDFEKLARIQEIFSGKCREGRFFHGTSVFDGGNLESDSNYGYNQVSVRYLLVATRSVDLIENCPISALVQQRERLLEQNGLDINSCLQFLVDFYDQLLKQAQTPVRFLHEVVRSTVIISDLFTDRNQFHWMLDTFNNLIKVQSEDELLNQYLIVGICKAVAVIMPDLECFENLKKNLVQCLKSPFIPARMASVSGLLYVLEGCILTNIGIGGISEEMQIMLPTAVEYVQCTLNNTGVLQYSQQHTMLVWSLALYLIENVDEVHMEANFVANTFQAACSILQHEETTVRLHDSLLKGFERLILMKKVPVKTQLLSLILEQLKSNNPHKSMLGFQIFLTFMYTDCSDHLESKDSNPDRLVETMEKITIIFEHIKKCFPFEVEIVCDVLSQILSDFFSPPDILNKVIGEFLSNQQPHPKYLSRVVFKVFERSIKEQQLSLLQDWVVFSLSNITQSLSVSMATWCLTCFFISASTNKHLRLFFPFVQSRVGRYEFEDRQMLCIAGADFYNNLTDGSQKRNFIENFSKIKGQPDTLFDELLSSL